MKPAVFSYHRPSSLDAVLALLAEYGYDAKVIAGGQSLGPMMNMRFAQPMQVIDLNSVPELSGVSRSGDTLRVGAMTRHHEVATDLQVRDACPLLAAAAATVGHYAIRQRGTLGGSLAHADPAAQLPLVAVTLGARIQVAGPNGTREIAAAEFPQAAMMTVLEPEEIITAVHFPCRVAGEGHGFELFNRRHGDFAIASCAVTASVTDGVLATLRLGVGAVGDVPVALDALADSFIGAQASPQTFGQIAEAAAAAVEPLDNPQISAEYRRDLVKALCMRALTRACRRA